MHAAAIDVEVNDGIVTLNGRLRSHAEKLAAERAADFDADLIAMGAYGRGRLRELVLGDVPQGATVQHDGAGTDGALTGIGHNGPDRGRTIARPRPPRGNAPAAQRSPAPASSSVR
ncbi:hypothetical protein BKK81_33965 (plasmid) [Cupriavidus sp. USMAHM13]|nr:hypothetical protein BKK81_33965 [Cupriavidus sp. USMAHM13]